MIAGLVPAAVGHTRRRPEPSVEARSHAQRGLLLQKQGDRRRKRKSNSHIVHEGKDAEGKKR